MAVFFCFSPVSPVQSSAQNTHFFRVEKVHTNEDSWEAEHTEALLKPLKEGEFGKLRDPASVPAISDGGDM